MGPCFADGSDVPRSVFGKPYKAMLAVLLDARRDAGVTQVELSRRLGKPQPFVSNVETGLRRLDVIEFYAMARALGRDPVDLFSEIVRKLPKKVEI